MLRENWFVSTAPTVMKRFMLHSLRHKFLVGASLGLGAMSLALLGLMAALYQYQLSQERSQASREINHLLEAALENAMLKRDLPGLRDIIDRLGRQNGARGAMIVAPDGEIRFSSNPKRLGKRFDSPVPTDCDGCGLATEKPMASLFITDEYGKEVMRSLNPVPNQARCSACHGDPATHKINGLLVVDYDATPIRRQAALSAAALAGMGLFLLASTLLGSAWFIHRYVLRPTSRLAQLSRALSEGRLDSRVTLDGDDELAQLGKTFNDMAQRLQEHIRRVGEQEAFLEALVDAIPDGIRVIDAVTFKIVLDNRAYRQLLALPDTAKNRGVTCHASSHGRDTPCPAYLVRCPILETMKTEAATKTLMEFNRVDGGKTKVEVFAAPMTASHEGKTQRYVVESARDLRQIVAFSQEQRLGEIALLATGVAHEIHNPLTSIRIALHATLRLTEAEPEQYASVRDYLRLVDQEIDRCIDVTDRLLKLGAAPPPSPQLVDLGKAVGETLSLLAWEARERGVAIETRWPDPAPQALANDADLRMIALNLIQNALHAMPKGGCLSIEMTQADGWLAMHFTDTGVGISTHDRERIFEPFFSRRADGVRGTGLGLAICEAIATSHGGRIECRSEIGAGSRFSVFLPDPSLPDAP
jgi:signal transduction histidine kinase